MIGYTLQIEVHLDKSCLLDLTMIMIIIIIIILKERFDIRKYKSSQEQNDNEVCVYDISYQSQNADQKLYYYHLYFPVLSVMYLQSWFYYMTLLLHNLQLP